MLPRDKRFFVPKIKKQILDYAKTNQEFTVNEIWFTIQQSLNLEEISISLLRQCLRELSNEGHLNCLPGTGRRPSYFSLSSENHQLESLRIIQLEQEIAQLKQEIEGLKECVAELKENSLSNLNPYFESMLKESQLN